MNIFEKFANEVDEELETAFEDEMEEETTEEEEVKEEKVVTEEAATISEDGNGNFVMNIPEDPKKVLEDNKKKEAQKKDNKSKAKSKSKGIEVKAPVEKKKTKEEEIEEKFKDYTKLIVKVFGTVEFEYDNPDEIKLLTLEEVTNRLIIERDYEEFTNGIVWSLVPGKDKTTGYLIPTYKFHPKG